MSPKPVPARATSPDLAERFRNGDDAALDELVEAYGVRLKAYHRAMVRSEELAEELTQETFLRAYQYRHQLRESSRLEGWLFSMARHMALREAGRARHRLERSVDPEVLGTMDEADPGRDARDGYLQEQQHRLLEEALASLEPKRRDLMALRYFSELSLAEIAEIQGMPLGSVGTTIGRSLESLKRWFERKGLGPKDLLP